jgi:hypothetical protein
MGRTGSAEPSSEGATDAASASCDDYDLAGYVHFPLSFPHID